MKLLMSVPTSTTSERPYTILKQSYWGDYLIRNDDNRVITVSGWRFRNPRSLTIKLLECGYVDHDSDLYYPSYLYKKKSFLNNFK